jgi:ATPase family associated with various cellular activities (AAA)
MKPLLSRPRLEKADPHFIGRSLAEPSGALTYRISQQFAELHQDKHTLRTDDYEFDVRAYSDAGHCIMRPRDNVFVHINTRWDSDDREPHRTVVDGWFEVEWAGQLFDLLIITTATGFHNTRFGWLASDSEAAAEQFMNAVVMWNHEAHGEVLVFDDEVWRKDARLFKSIKTATLENLILAGTLKEDILHDLQTFFGARDTYERYGVPWRRGLLLLGPPGNGKTHAVKGLVNALGKPCLYVKSIAGDKPSASQANIRRIFERARSTAPCILVLEDLDSLVTDENRSVFLNELDGFVHNGGIVTLATTNHPEKLDPAIIDRPSRFDRKYHFGLPSHSERTAYLALWNSSLQPELKMTAAGIEHAAQITDSFSFAYLKELVMSSITAWMSVAPVGGIDSVITDHAALLRAQMTTESATITADED